MLEREAIPPARGGAAALPAKEVEGFGAGPALPWADPRGDAANAPGFATGFTVGFTVGFATGLGAGFGAATELRDPDGARVAREEEGFATALESGFGAGLGAGATPACRDGFGPRDAIEGGGVATGFGAGFETVAELRGGFEVRGGAMRATDRELGRGAAREIDGALGACRTAMGGREAGAILGTLGLATGALRAMLGREAGALGLVAPPRGEEGAAEGPRPPEEPPPPAFRWLSRPCVSGGTGPKGTSSKAAAQAASRDVDVFMFAREKSRERTKGLRRMGRS